MGPYTVRHKNCDEIVKSKYLTNSLNHRPDILECRLFSPMRLRDLDFLDELQGLEDVGDIIEPSDPRLHDGIGKAEAVDDFRRKLQI